MAWAVFATIAAEDPPGLSRFEFAETHMGSAFQLVLYTRGPDVARRASRAAFDRIAALDASFSDYDPESELMRLCDRSGGPAVPVSADLFEILARSSEMSRRSDGAFDATVGPAVRLWRRARRDGKMPEPGRLAEARARVDWRAVVLDERARTARLEKPGMKLDLGGIAKGYASQAAVEVLRREGVPVALCAGAGDIVAGDPPPGAEGWSVALATLGEAAAGDADRIVLRNAAASTSGDAEKFVVIDGRRYSHVVDPRTGLGVVDRAGVTVVAPDGATADAVDTACYVLGPEKGLAFVDSVEGCAARFVRRTPEGDRVFESARWGAARGPGPAKPEK